MKKIIGITILVLIFGTILIGPHFSPDVDHIALIIGELIILGVIGLVFLACYLIDE